LCKENDIDIPKKAKKEDLIELLNAQLQDAEEDDEEEEEEEEEEVDFDSALEELESAKKIKEIQEIADGVGYEDDLPKKAAAAKKALKEWIEEQMESDDEEEEEEEEEEDDRSDPIALCDDIEAATKLKELKEIAGRNDELFGDLDLDEYKGVKGVKQLKADLMEIVAPDESHLEDEDDEEEEEEEKPKKAPKKQKKKEESKPKGKGTPGTSAKLVDILLEGGHTRETYMKRAQEEGIPDSSSKTFLSHAKYEKSAGRYGALKEHGLLAKDEDSGVLYFTAYGPPKKAKSSSKKTSKKKK